MNQSVPAREAALAKASAAQEFAKQAADRLHAAGKLLPLLESAGLRLRPLKADQFTVPCKVCGKANLWLTLYGTLFWRCESQNCPTRQLGKGRFQPDVVGLLRTAVPNHSEQQARRLVEEAVAALGGVQDEPVRPVAEGGDPLAVLRGVG
jgi:hypothetical protein